MMKMDITRSEPSPSLSENVGSWSWGNWETEVGSLSGLNSGSHTEMYGLMEDKEIAARAVAFVVNSTRKGIVPLCADVANLLRSKRCLERKVYMLKRQNDVFRSSASASLRTSQSTSPTPPSLSSYTEHCMKALQDHTFNTQERHRPCSSCSQCSSTLSYSPKIEKTRSGSFRLSCLQRSPGSGREGHRHDGSGYQHSSLFSFRENNHGNHVSLETEELQERKDKDVDSEHHKTVTQVEIHSPPAKDAPIKDQEPELESELGFKVACELITRAEIHEILNKGVSTGLVQTEREESNNQVTFSAKDEDQFVETFVLSAPSCGQRMNHSSIRRNSLPEMVSTPNKDAQRVCPKISKEVQCSLSYYGNQDLEEQFVKTVRLNSNLVDDLAAARKEIELLKKRLKELEKSETGREPSDQLFYENEDGKSLEDNGYYTSSNKTTRSTKMTHNGYNKRSSPKRSATTPVSYVGPILNCKCSACQEAMGSDDDLSHYSDHLGDEPPRYAVSSKLQVQLDDHVVVKGDLTGYIRYIGHIDNRSAQTNLLFVGLELDSTGGRHDGYYQGKRYFLCGKDRGLFVPLQEVICKVSKKVSKNPKAWDGPSFSGSRPRRYHKKPSPLLDKEEKSTSKSH